MTTPQTTAYYSSHPLGSVSEMSGAGGTLLGQYDRNPFGDGATSSNVDPSVAGSPFAFAGEYQDPTTGLYNLRARQYDTTTGRFLSRDPAGPQDYTSLYTYAGDNPLAYTDPSGMRRTPSGPPRTNPCVGFSCGWRWIKDPRHLVPRDWRSFGMGIFDTTQGEADAIAGAGILTLCDTVGAPTIVTALACTPPAAAMTFGGGVEYWAGVKDFQDAYK